MHCMVIGENKKMKAQKLLNELKEIKSEKSSKRDIKRVKLALKEYREGKSIQLSKLPI